VIDLLGHFFYVWILLGVVLLSSKNKWGWACRLVGEVGWVVLGFMMNMSSIWAWGFAFVFIDICAFIGWRRHDNE
jgi:hypothetical protein